MHGREKRKRLRENTGRQTGMSISAEKGVDFSYCKKKMEGKGKS